MENKFQEINIKNLERISGLECNDKNIQIKLMQANKLIEQILLNKNTENQQIESHSNQDLPQDTYIANLFIEQQNNSNNHVYHNQENMIFTDKENSQSKQYFNLVEIENQDCDKSRLYLKSIKAL